jgi:hypothetical protein
MTPHLLAVRSAKADRPHGRTANREDKAMRNAVDQAESSVPILTVVKPVVGDDGLDLDIASPR